MKDNNDNDLWFGLFWGVVIGFVLTSLLWSYHIKTDYKPCMDKALDELTACKVKLIETIVECKRK